MAEQLLGEFEQNISRLTLIPSGGGRFEVMLDDRMVYSKAETGQHPDYGTRWWCTPCERPDIVYEDLLVRESPVNQAGARINGRLTWRTKTWKSNTKVLPSSN